MIEFIASYIVPVTFFVLAVAFLSQALGKKRLDNHQQAILVALIFGLAVIPVWSVSGPVGDAANKGKVRADDIRISLEALSIEANYVEQMRIGGDREKDWIYVKGVAANLLSFRRATNADGSAPTNPEDAPIEMVVKLNSMGPGSLVTYESTSRTKKNRKIVGARKLVAGENICINCLPKSSQTLTQRCNVTMPRKKSSLSMQMGGHALPPIRLRKLKGPIPALVNYGPVARIYSLRNFGRPLDNENVSSECQKFVDETNSAVLPSGFIYKEKNRNSPFYGALLPGGPDTATIPLKLEKGGPGLRIRLFRVRYAEPGRNPEPEDLIERLAERRSFKVSYNEKGMLRIQFDTPEISQIKAKNIANAILKKKDAARLVLTFDSTDNRSRDANYTDAIVSFRSLGRPAARATTGQIELPLKDGAIDDLEDEFYLPSQDIRSSQKLRYPWGKSFNLGGNVQATITLDRLDHFANMSVLLYTLLLASIFLNFFALYKPIAKTRPVLWSLALVVQTLICLRILIGISGGYVDPDASDSAGGAIMLLAIAPVILYLTSGNLLDIKRTAISAIFLLLVFLTLTKAGEITPVSRLLFILSEVMLAISYVWTQSILLKIIPARLGWTQVINSVDLFIGKRVSTKKGKGAVKQVLRNILASPVTQLVFLLVVARSLLALLGQKEALVFAGSRFSNSIWYIPGAILVLAILWSRYHRSPQLRKSLWFSLILGLAIGGLFFFPALALNDVGIIIFCLGGGACIMLDSLSGADRRVLLVAAGYAAVSLLVFWILVQQVETGFNTMKLFLVTVLTIFAACAFFADTRRAKRPYVILCFVVVLILIYVAFGSEMANNAGKLAFILAIVLFIGFLLMPDDPSQPWVEALVKVRPATFFIVLLMLLVSFNLPTIGSSFDNQDRGASTEAALERQLNSDQNMLRLLFILNPDASRDFGTAESERLSAALAHFSDYTDCPADGRLACRFKGQGFLNVPKPTELYAVHMDDNVSAIYLTAQFGRASAAGLITMLLCFALFFSRVTQRRLLENETGSATRNNDVGSSPLVIYGRFLVWTVAFVALYMVLANYRIVPFTGQNIFFLAAKSGSDALFGLTIFSLIALSLKRYANG